MAYLEHIGIFDSLADEYQALTYGGIKFPFVAKVNGVIDYNGQYFTDEPVVIAYDSEGSKLISGTTSASGIYNFSFQTDTDAGFELYNNYSAVTASTCLIEADADCEGTVTDTERGIDETDYEMVAVGFDWDGYHDEDSASTVDINITFNTNDMSVSGIATVSYCEPTYKVMVKYEDEGGLGNTRIFYNNEDQNTGEYPADLLVRIMWYFDEQHPPIDILPYVTNYYPHDSSLKAFDFEDSPIGQIPFSSATLVYEFLKNYVPSYMFDGDSLDHSLISEVCVGEGIEEIHYYAFNGNRNATGLSFSASTDISLDIGAIAFESFGAEANDGEPNMTVTLPESASRIGINAFNNSGMRTLIMERSDPPEMNNEEGTTLGEVEAIYVPDDAVSDYQDAVGWHDYASNIHSINDL